MQSKIRRKNVAVRPSRIRRDPVPLERKADLRKVEARSREREMWGGVAGVLLFAVAVVLVTVGIAAGTIFRADPNAAAQEARFGQCYNGGVNCVVDGGTVYVQGEKLSVAGLDTPRILDSHCSAERSRGIDAALKLADLLNRGKVTVGPTFRDEFGHDVRKVQVGGQDVARAMVSAGVASEARADPHDWCAPADE